MVPSIGKSAFPGLVALAATLFLKIPVASAQGIEFQSMAFYESGYNATEEERKNTRTTFNQTSTRYMNIQLNIRNLQAGGASQNVTITYIYYNADGSVFNRSDRNHTIPSDWSTAWISSGYGWAEAGNWAPGRYRVEAWLGGRKFGENAFTITDDRPQWKSVEFLSIQFFEGNDYKKD